MEILVLRPAEELFWWNLLCLPRLSFLPRLPYCSYLVSHRPRLSLLDSGGVLGGSGLARDSLSKMSLGVGLLSLPCCDTAGKTSNTVLFTFGFSGTGGPFLRPATGDLELSWCMETCWPRWGELVNTLSLSAVGVTDLSLTESLLPTLSFRVTGGDVEKLLCSDRDKSLVSLTGRGFLTLS